MKNGNRFFYFSNKTGLEQFSYNFLKNGAWIFKTDSCKPVFLHSLSQTQIQQTPSLILEKLSKHCLFCVF